MKTLERPQLLLVIPAAMLLSAILFLVRLGHAPHGWHYIAGLGVALISAVAGTGAALAGTAIYILAGVVGAWDTVLTPGIISLSLFLVYTALATGLVFSLRSQVSRLKRRVSILRRATFVLHAEVDLNTLFRKYVKMVVDDLGFCDAAILLKKDESLVVKAAANFPPDKGPGFRLARGEGLAWEAMETGQMVINENCSEDPRYVQGIEGAILQISIPIGLGREKAGVLVVESLDKGPPSQDSIYLLTALSEQASVAIEKAALLEETKRLAALDGLTGVYNHRFLKARLSEEVERARRVGGEVALLMLDVDGLKSTNDRFGHTAGDEALKAFARLLQSNTRQVDVVARYGGDEFAVIAPDAGREAALVMAKRLREALSNGHSRSCSGPPCLTAGIGVAVFPWDADNWEGLINEADARLYAAKRGYRKPAVHASLEIPVESCWLKNSL